MAEAKLGLSRMLWYVAFIAALNLGAGYYWGAYVRRCPRCRLMREAEILALAPAAARGAHASLAGGEAYERSGAAPPEDARQLRRASDEIAEPAVPVDPATGLVTREYAEEVLAQLSAAGGDNRLATAALVEVNCASGGKGMDGVVAERLFRGVAMVVKQSLERKDLAACFGDQQILLLLPEEDVPTATRQAEEFRQRVASTEFVADGNAIQTTVTCALAEIAPESTGPRLFEFLAEALGEAKRYGGNRTFMHDGNSPTPVVPSELTVAPQQLAI
jgi:GGDEF domain-containing protein